MAPNGAGGVLGVVLLALVTIAFWRQLLLVLLAVVVAVFLVGLHEIWTLIGR